MTTARQAVAQLGEAAAARFLQHAGHSIIVQNYRCRYGEIDIVARDGPSLVFVEVRARSSDRFGTPEESITEAKAQRMTRCALAYLSAHAAEQEAWRIDLIAIDVAHGRITRLEHYRHVLL
jgi:putative endonuclease